MRFAQRPRMGGNSHKEKVHHASKPKKHLVKHLNGILSCAICRGYLIDAVTLVSCMHTFCRACVVCYFNDPAVTQCPSCQTSYRISKREPLSYWLREDVTLQSIVYKLIPGLYRREMQRRQEFGTEENSSSVDCAFFSNDDCVSISLEYYHPSTQLVKSISSADANNKAPPLLHNGARHEAICNGTTTVRSSIDDCYVDVYPGPGTDQKRYLQCPAAVSMRHLQKFVRLKFALTTDHRVDIVYKDEVLPADFMLMDVAYTFRWKRVKPMRFFYRIFTPLKIQPIRIITTTIDSGEKQRHVVPSKSPSRSPVAKKSPNTPSLQLLALPELPPLTTNLPETPAPSSQDEAEDEEDFDAEQEDEEDEEGEEEKQEEENVVEKERLFANLQLQSKNKVVTKLSKATSTALPNQVSLHHSRRIEPSSPSLNVFDYREPDPEEIRRFAETRDREWLMQKKLEDQRELLLSRASPVNDLHRTRHHNSKKRKKNKHSKSETTHKKRKLHAEITKTEEDLKLKVKLTHNNGHKHHRHHRSGSSTPSSTSPRTPPTPPLSSKSPGSDRVSPKVAEDTVIPSVSSPCPPDIMASKAKPPNMPPLATCAAKDNELQQQLKGLQQRCCVVEKKPVTEIAGGFTVSKIEYGAAISNTSSSAPSPIHDKRPSLEITLIPPAAPTNSPKRPPPPPIPLDRIRRAFKPSSAITITPRRQEGGVLDLSTATISTSKSSSSPVEQHHVTLTNRSTSQMCNLQMLSKVAADMKLSTTTISSPPPPTSQPSTASILHQRIQQHQQQQQHQQLSPISKRVVNHNSNNHPLHNLHHPTPPPLKIPQLHSMYGNGVNNSHLITLTTTTATTVTTHSSNFVNKLAKLPKLNEINRSQFRAGALAAAANATAQASGASAAAPFSVAALKPSQNQSIRNIPNPSLVVRQQTQNRRLQSIGEIAKQMSAVGMMRPPTKDERILLHTHSSSKFL